MIKPFYENFFVKFLKKIYIAIDNSLKNYLNKYLKNSKKLDFNDFNKIAKSNKFFLTFVALIILFLSYLSIPNAYDKSEIRKELKNQLLNNLSLNFNFSKNLKYSFFPRPHFTSENSIIIKNKNKIAEIKKLKIYVSLNNLFSLDGIEVNDLILENANFNLNSQNYNFFTKLLDENFKDKNLIINDSNIFYRNSKNEVLFINKILKMKYYYDTKDLNNIVILKNEIFNVPYSLELRDDKINKKIFSKLNLKFLKFQIKDEINYTNNVTKGSSNLIFDKNKSNIMYEIKKNDFIFKFFDKLNNSKFFYRGKVNYKPFYSSFVGIEKEIDLSSMFNPNSLVSELFKAGIFHNNNLNFELTINADKIKNHYSFMNISLNSRIQEGLVDLNNTKFFWKDFVSFKISDSLIFVKDSQLILDGKLDVEINDLSEIYQFLLTPKNYRTEIKKLEANFNYNFDQKILSFNDIKIDNKKNQNLKDSLKNLIFKNGKLQNKIYLKNKINKALRLYVG